MKNLLQQHGAMVDRGFQIYNLDGELQNRIPLSTIEKYGAERLIFHRIDLHEALKVRATSTSYPGRPVEIRTSSRVTSCNCTTGVVHLADGTSIGGDLVIGADGIKSVLRASVLNHDVRAMKTGHSAYRMVLQSRKLEDHDIFRRVVGPREPYTTMVMGYDKRLIMGPARGGDIYSIVAMVPDETMHEKSDNSSWTTPGNLSLMLKTFDNFPAWTKVPLKLADEAGLWQLRDIDQLKTWYRGRCILIGDAAHAMLPTQGQGASQSIEDAEALGAFFTDLNNDAECTNQEIERRNSLVFEARYARASLIQGYSRQTARPATGSDSNRIKLNPAEFMDYNCSYDGAIKWLENQRQADVERKSALNECGTRSIETSALCCSSQCRSLAAVHI